MENLTTAESKFGASVPVMKYNFSAGIRIPTTTAAPSASDAMEEGAYLVTATADVFLSLSGDAGNEPGSMLLSGGIPFHLLVEAGQLISARSVLMPATVFAIPLE